MLLFASERPFLVCSHESIISPSHCCSLQKFVREQILQVVAMMFKRGALDKSKEGCGDLLKNVSHLLQTGDKDMVG